MNKGLKFIDSIYMLLSACVMGMAILVCVGNQGSHHGKSFEQGYKEGRIASDEEAYQAYLGIAQNAKDYKAAQRKQKTVSTFMAELEK